ncbi:hypothetical protein LTR37_019342 [Vermiconidia calcicola]|uniref:Uncharacterized protein n=1 Tax=Vermiconidia calcicola TaxID=1690605 RepID=A0ACC3MGA7_9PEZI|nr:hypothetical protein LTR37_019342 [Vermiconidia calcicola]
MAESSLDLKSTISGLPPLPAEDFRKSVESFFKESTSKVPVLVALDDDPTGTQTCHNVNVLTVWDTNTLADEFRQTPRGGGFFILTNSRALHPQQAQELMHEICTNLKCAAQEANVEFEVVLRGDSTLRGHFPIEPESAEDIVGKADAWILCPFFLQGGRYTINDVHYVAEGDELVPAGKTAFARDATFGYRSSNLRDWVVEKSKGNIPADRVQSLTIGTIRKGGPQAIKQQLMDFPKGSVVIVNAAATEDVDAVILGLLQADAAGKKLLFRTGAAFVSSRLAISQIEPISAKQLSLSSSVGGLIIAGSYVPKTTSQLEVLRARSGDKLTSVVLDVPKLLESEQSAANMMGDAVAQAEKEISRGRDVLVMTSRDIITGEDETRSLDIGSKVAKALVSFLVDLKTRPRYIISKGGITSSDMATKGLKMKRALIVGQAAPGVPLWRCDEPSSKWSGLPYVVFPGNVGSEETLYQVVERWRV